MPDKQLNLTMVKSANLRPHGPVVFSVMRDEDYFLPFFFDHYRKLGVDGFLIYDDRSGAPTLDFLNAQPDCAIVRSEHAFGDSFTPEGEVYDRRLPHVLKESVPEGLLRDRWVLTVDADEFLVLPSEFRDLPQLIETLERLGRPYLTAPMVDFYGETLAARNYPRDLNPFDANPYFDCGPYYFWNGDPTPTPLNGGVRHKLLRRLFQAHPKLMSQIHGLWDPMIVWKSPLLKHGVGVVRSGDHRLNIAPSPGVEGVLAHFKFYPDLDAKIAMALKERQYVSGSLQYRILKTAIDLMGEESLVTWETCRYEGPASLEAAQLMRGTG
jgi:hypothetical protein